MICVQNATPNSDGRILIASDLLDTRAAAQETEDWLSAHGYEPVLDARPLLVYEDGVRVREWMQAQPQLPRPTVSQSDFPRSARAWLSSLLHLHPHTAQYQVG